VIVSRQRLVRDRLPLQCLHSIQTSTGPHRDPDHATWPPGVAAAEAIKAGDRRRVFKNEPPGSFFKPQVRPSMLVRRREWLRKDREARCSCWHAPPGHVALRNAVAGSQDFMQRLELVRV